jgi:hypothetical protein
MQHSNHRNVAADQTDLPIWLKVSSITLSLLMFSLGPNLLLSQQDTNKQENTGNKQSTGKKVNPSSRGTINIQEIEKREKANKEAPKQKKIENENLKEPRDLPVPRGAKGKTYKVPPPEKKNVNPALEEKEKKQQSSLAPQFPAIGDNNTTIPPDMGGAVGPNHVMTALNSQVRIQDKSGATISTVTLNGFFSPLVGTFNVFDPKVLYDPFAGRWIITAPANSNSATSSLLIAVSSTNDPTAPWTGYAFDVDAANANWFDYPSIGFNHNWIVVTGNLFQVVAPNTPDPFAGEQVYIFDKAALYAGPSAPTVLNRPTTEGGTMCPAITLDNSMDTEFLVSNWNGNSGGNGFLRIFTVTGTPAAPVFTATMLFPSVNQPWGSAPNATGADFAPQNTVTQLIQNNDSRAQDVVFQNGSVWVAQSAFLPAAAPTHSAAQWWQIDPTTATVQQFGRVEDTTANNFFAFPSIAVNAYNDVLLGYSSFSATQFASCNYSFRLHTDAINTMQASVQFKAGLAKYFKTFSGTKNRWGDYSTSCIDPDNFSLWTIQEYADNPSGGSDRWGTEWNRLVPPVPNLYIKDVAEDVGAEPDPSTLPMWLSEDIWLRKLQDSSHAFAHMHQDAEFRSGTSNPNYVYVEVHNRGGASSAGTEQLTLYWAKASSGLSWPDPWNGGVFFDPPTNTMLMGGVIGTVTIPVIASGASNILEFAWNPPDPAVYGVFGADQNHFCLLARVTTSGTAPFGMTFPETSDLYGNVQKNNHVVWKNIEVYDLLPGTQAPAYAVITNLSPVTMNVKLKFTALDAAGNAGLLDKGILRVTAGGKLKAILDKSRQAGEGIRNTGDGRFEIVKDGGFLQGIPLEPKDYGTLELTFVPNQVNEKMTGYAITVTQLDQATGGDRIVGGQTFVFGMVKGFGTSPGGGARHWPWWYWLVLALIVIVLLLLWRRKK